MIRALAVALAALPLAVAAQVQGGVMDARGPTGSPRWGSVEVGVERYRPDIDSEFDGAGAYRTVFEGGDRWMFRLAISKALFTRMGSVEVGFRTGYFQDSALALALVDDDQNPATPPVYRRAMVDTQFHIVPTSLSLTYRFDWLVDRYRYVPFAPYVRGTLERYNWWVSDDDGETESGATNGWSGTAGVAFLLDILDRTSARDMDRETGVNHTYLFFEATKSGIDDFGSSSSWDLSDEGISLAAGLLFVF